MRGKSAVVLFVVVFLLVAAVIGTYLSETPNKQPATEPSAPGSDVVIIPSETTSVPTAAPSYVPIPTAPVVPTPAPTPIPTPAPTPIPTPEPTVVIPSPPAETVYGTSLGSGTYYSETGVGLNIRADWSAVTVSDTQVDVVIAVSADSYSLHCQASSYSVNVNLAGQYVSLDAPAIDYDGTTSINTKLASRTFTVNLSQGQSDSFHLDVAWSFGGTYQGMELPSIECGGDILLTR